MPRKLAARIDQCSSHKGNRCFVAFEGPSPNSNQPPNTRRPNKSQRARAFHTPAFLSHTWRWRKWHPLADSVFQTCKAATFLRSSVFSIPYEYAASRRRMVHSFCFVLAVGASGANCLAAFMGYFFAVSAGWNHV